MGIESAPQQSDYESMTFQELEEDPIAGPFLQRAALEYLETEDAAYFKANFSGERDEEGYLLRKDGTNSNTLPSQNIGGGNPMNKVRKRALEFNIQ